MMKLCIHRGTHQIGGMSTEIATAKARILIDMGSELSLDAHFQDHPLSIPGITDDKEHWDAVLLTHYHGDHMGQILRIRPEIPLYAGALAQDIMKLSAKHHHQDALYARITAMRTFASGKPLPISDMKVIPFSIDHSAVDSYFFLICAEGKRLLYTGDFRLHGIRHKGMKKLLKRIGHVDILVTEGTTLSRSSGPALTEWDLQKQLKQYLAQYKYVFVLCSTTNLDRIFAFAKAVPSGKYCLCDAYQKILVKAVSDHWCLTGSSPVSDFYHMSKMRVYGKSILSQFKEQGGLFCVRGTDYFKNIIQQGEKSQILMIYSMWDGYRTKAGSSIPDFLALTGHWERLHTSGHATPEAIQTLIQAVTPDIVIPMHTDAPEQIQSLCGKAKVLLPEDNEILLL